MLRWPMLATGSALVLIGLWALRARPSSELVAEMAIAALFLAVGLVIHDAPTYRRPYKQFSKLFRGIPAKLLARSADAYQVVLPHFRVNPNVGQELQTLLESQSSDKGIYDLYRNPSVDPYWENLKVTLSVAVAGNDSQAAGLIIGSVSRLTQGAYSPVIQTDDAHTDAALSKPSILLGLYSNSWVHVYWDYTRWRSAKNTDAVFLPMPHQVGFWLRKSDDTFVRYLPLATETSEIANFWDDRAPSIMYDYAIIARVKGQESPSARWLVCAGIGKAGTVGAATYLARDSNLRRLCDTFREEQFAIVLRISVRNLADSRVVASWPPRPEFQESDEITRISSTLQQVRDEYNHRHPV